MEHALETIRRTMEKRLIHAFEQTLGSHHTQRFREVGLDEFPFSSPASCCTERMGREVNGRPARRLGGQCYCWMA